MKAMSLDISTKVGFAVGNAAAKPIFGTHPLPKPLHTDDFGSRFAAFDLWLADQLTVHAPDMLAFESPIPPRGTNIDTMWGTIRLLIGLVSIAEMAASHAGIACIEVAVPTWKKGFTGSGRADKTDVITKCMGLGFMVATDHEADAIGILSHVLHVHRQPPTWDAGQMVRGLPALSDRAQLRRAAR
jgi:Holliday junction resolvasome RuvABC endonuclease subunit